MASKISVRLPQRSTYQRLSMLANYSSSKSNVAFGEAAISSQHDKQMDLFFKYKAKMMAAKIPRVEKIEVNFVHAGIGDDAMLLMNKGLSTPYNCAQHISQTYIKDSVLALVKKSQNDREDQLVVLDKNDDDNDPHQMAGTVDSEWVPWDMHRPLEYDCDLKLLKFNSEISSAHETALVNDAYWNACSVVLGAVVKQAFKTGAMVKLTHLPDRDIRSGAFCYDIELHDRVLDGDSMMRWYKDDSALVELTKVARHVISQNHLFERVEIPKEEAELIFSDNEHMRVRLDKTYATVHNDTCVPMYRFGNFLDIIDGPLIPSTSFMFHYVVTAMHRLGNVDEDRSLYRFQGLSLPKDLQVHHAIWAMLEHRAKRLVRKDLLFDTLYQDRDKDALHKYRSIENQTKKFNFVTGQWLEDAWLSKKDLSK